MRAHAVHGSWTERLGAVFMGRRSMKLTKHDDSWGGKVFEMGGKTW